MNEANKPVRKAIIPVAGLGTRFLPVTRAVPKALLPVLSRPIVHYSVQEAVEAGIREIVLILSPGMESVAEYFASQPALEEALRSRGKQEELDEQLQISGMANVSTLIQHEPRGLGHAVLMAREFVGDEPFALFLPDDLIWNDQSAVSQLLAVRERHGGSVIAVKEVPDEEVESKGIVDAQQVEEDVFSVRRVVEKPKLADAPSNLSIIGRYVLEPEVFPYLAEERSGAGGEIQITDAIESTIGKKPLHACAFKGFHADAGVPSGMLRAALFEARKDPELRQVAVEAVQAWESEGSVR